MCIRDRCLYVGLILILLSAFEITLTLPGVAGIILSIGMAVDANVIIFTRIKEEIAVGKTVKSAIDVYKRQHMIISVQQKVAVYPNPPDARGRIEKPQKDELLARA